MARTVESVENPTETESILKENKDSQLYLVSAPSCGGKTTLFDLLTPDKRFARAVTCTTRPPRIKQDTGQKEIDGVDYHFHSISKFLLKIGDDDFLEYARFGGHLYGTCRNEIERLAALNKHILLNIEVNGAEQIRKKACTDYLLKRALVQIFLTPPTLGILEERLCKRKANTPEEIKKRLAEAPIELEKSKEYDYLIVSTTPEEDLRRMMVIFYAENMKRSSILLDLVVMREARSMKREFATVSLS
ncbi:MAG: guanylate kinase [bacterium]|nr:guanylate kinase [bacterium]